METGHGFTVQGRLDGSGDEADIDALLSLLEAGGAVEPAVSVNREFVGVTAYFYAKDAEQALAMFDAALPNFDTREIV